MVGRSLTAYRGALAVAAAMPVVRELLVSPGSDAGWVTALTDDAGRLLWVEGEQGVRRQMEGVGFVEGSLWREDCAGTNALGTALAIDQPLQVVGYEHYARKVHPWNCAAVPVHAPTGQVLGVLDVTGGPIVASAVVMSLVRATVAAVEAELARIATDDARTSRLIVRSGGDLDLMPRLRVLSTTPDASGRRRRRAPEPAARRDPSAARPPPRRAQRRRARGPAQRPDALRRHRARRGLAAAAHRRPSAQRVPPVPADVVAAHRRRTSCASCSPPTTSRPRCPTTPAPCSAGRSHPASSARARSSPRTSAPPSWPARCPAS